MSLYLVLKTVHIIGANILFGTGIGIAFFMVVANSSRDPKIIAQTASTVVLADTLFTATAVVVQPITGALLIWTAGFNPLQSWIVFSLILYVVTGMFWLPVVWIQIQMRDLARASLAAGTPLPASYHRLYRIWFLCGIPAFAAVVAIFALMTVKPMF